MKGASGVAQKTSAVGVKKLPFQAHLSDCRVQVVHDHQHDGGGLTGTARVLIDGVSPGEGGGGGGVIASPATGILFATAATCLALLVSPHGQRGAEAVHVDVPVLPELLGKLWRERCMVGRGEIAQRISQSQL